MANKWLQHVKQVKAQNKNLQLKEVLQLAKKSYKKQKQQGGGSLADNASPVDAAPVKEDFGHAGGDEKEEKADDAAPAAQAGGKKSRKNRKNRNNKNNKQQGGKRRSRKNKGKKSKRRAAGKKARRTRRRRR